MAKKKIVLCDTNIIIDLFKDEQRIVKEIKDIGEQSIYISSITAAELYYGALNKRIFHLPINYNCIS